MPRMDLLLLKSKQVHASLLSFNFICSCVLFLTGVQAYVEIVTNLYNHVHAPVYVVKPLSLEVLTNS